MGAAAAKRTAPIQKESRHLRPRRYPVPAVSWQALQAALGAPALDPASMLVHVLLADHADAEGRCWPSQRLLAERSGLSLSTVKRALVRLEAAGRITRTKRSGGKGRGRLSDLIQLQGVTVTPSNGYKVSNQRVTRGHSDLGISKEPLVDSFPVTHEDPDGRLWVDLG